MHVGRLFFGKEWQVSSRKWARNLWSPMSWSAVRLWVPLKQRKWKKQRPSIYKEVQPRWSGWFVSVLYLVYIWIKSYLSLKSKKPCGSHLFKQFSYILIEKVGSFDLKNGYTECFDLVAVNNRSTTGWCCLTIGWFGRLADLCLVVPGMAICIAALRSALTGCCEL